MTPLFPVSEDMSLDDGGVFADFDFTAFFGCQGFCIPLIGEEQPQPLTLITHRGFPSQNIENNHVAGFIHKAFQREDAVTADEVSISSHTRHHAL